MYLFQKNDEPEPIHDETECSKVRSKCSKCQTPFTKDKPGKFYANEGIGYICQSCDDIWFRDYEGLPSGARTGEGSGSSYIGEEGLCPECKSSNNYAKGENNPPSAFKCKDEKICLQLQKDKLKELQEKTSRTEEEQTEMIRLGNKLGVDIKYPRGSESDKKELEEKINELLKGIKAFKQLPKDYPGFSEYDKQQLEKKLTELKKKYKYKYGELPNSLRDDNDNREREKRESRIAQLRSEIQQLETLTNRTAEQERRLQELKDWLAQLENQQQSGGDPKDPNFAYLWIFLVIAILLIVGTIIYFLLKDKKPKQKRGRKSKIVGRVRKLLLDFTAYRSKDNTLTQQEMANRVREEEKVIISQQTVSKFLIKKKRTYKKIHPRYREQKISQVKQFEESIRHLPLTQFSAIDECHFYLNEAPRRGYAPIGQRAISPAPGSKGGSYSLIIWVKNRKGQGMVHWELTDQKVNTQVFYNFLDKVKTLGEEEDNLIIDNASFHRAPNKRKELGLPTIEEQLLLKNSRPLPFPTHSPMLNPVEPMINNIRRNIEKSRSWTSEQLRSSINKEMERLDKEDLTKYFKKCLQENLLKLINESEKSSYRYIGRIVLKIDEQVEREERVWYVKRVTMGWWEYRKVDI
jgi:DDE superfamily endonuclease